MARKKTQGTQESRGAFPPRDIAIRLDPKLFGSNLPGLLQYLGLKGRPQPDGVMHAGTTERARGRRVDLVQVRHLATPTTTGRRFDLLQRLSEEIGPLETGGDLKGDEAFYERVGRRHENGGDLAATAMLYTMRLYRADVAEIPAIAEMLYDGMGMSTVEGTEEELFRERSAHLISATDILRHRSRLPSVVLRLEQDPPFAEQIARGESGIELGTVFNSQSGLTTGLSLLDAYVAPLLGCLTPRLWAFHSVLSYGVLIYSFGTSLNGARAEPAELLQLLPAEHFSSTQQPKSTEAPEITPKACEEAVDWWSRKLQALFAVTSDPTLYPRADGTYSSSSHLNWLLTFEQIFRRCGALQAETRNQTARRSLAFSAMDAIGNRLNDHEIEQMCELKKAQKAAERVRSSMSSEAALLLMPAVDRAVAALEELQDGFFVPSPAGADTVTLVLHTGRTDTIPKARAAAYLMRILRNSTHGFGGKRDDANIERDAAILAQHDGNIPADVYLLAYLYLLDVLARPDDTRAAIYRRATSPSSNPAAPSAATESTDSITEA